MSGVAVAWTASITIFFCLPTANPVTTQTLVRPPSPLARSSLTSSQNYTPVAVGIITLYTFASWLLWANKWFKGPRQAALEEVGMEPGAAMARGDSLSEEKEEKVGAPLALAVSISPTA